MQTVGFIGLGKMGAPMASNLLKAGFTVQVYDRLRALADPIARAGATNHDNARSASVNADVIISMLPASEHVESLYLGEAGLLQHLAPGTLIVDCSTIAPASARRLHDAAGALGLAALDAPVSGGTTGAQAGTLTFIVGAWHLTFDGHDPFLTPWVKTSFMPALLALGKPPK